MRLREWATYKWADPNSDPGVKAMRWCLLMDQAFEGELLGKKAPTDKCGTATALSPVEAT